MTAKRLKLLPLVLGLLLLSACGGGGEGGGGSTPDTTPPTVTVTPANGATDIAISTTVSVNFSEAINCSTVTLANVTLSSSGGAVTGSITCSGSSATFTPTSALSYSTLYTLTVSTNVNDGAGNALANVFTSSFTTAAAPPVATYTVGGTVSGLVGSVVLQNNGTDDLTVSANESFTFGTSLAGGSAYNVIVLSQPSGQTCTAFNGSGTVGSANVTNVLLKCTPVIVDMTKVDSTCGSSGAVTPLAGGMIIGSTTWGLAGSPYYLQGDIIVPSGSTLSIQPGTIVCSASSDAQGSGANTAKVEIIVNGTLSVAGTAANPVIFVSAGFGSWHGIVVGSGGTANVSSAYVLHANAAGIRSEGALNVSNTVFARNRVGVELSSYGDIRSSAFLMNNKGVSTTVGVSSRLTNLLIYSNSLQGIHLTTPSVLEVYNSTIDNNGSDGVLVSAPTAGTSVIIKNAIITNNSGSGVGCSTTCNTNQLQLGGSNLWANGTNYTNLTAGANTISSNPAYVSPPMDYSLSPSSPSIDVGEDLSASVPADILGNTRPLDGNGDGIAKFDHGAFEQ